jgi:hypothetical protein
MIVFYFNSTPVMSLLIPGDPLSPERIAQRRAAVLDYVSAILFTQGYSQPKGGQS